MQVPRPRQAKAEEGIKNIYNYTIYPQPSHAYLRISLPASRSIRRLLKIQFVS
jgi:hypothetical protein